MRAGLGTALFLLAVAPAFSHRLDEYLQGTILSVEKNCLKGQITLTPGVAIFPLLIARIDLDANGSISDSESRAYAERVLGDLTIAINGNRVASHLDSVHVSTIKEMTEGRGEIKVEFTAEYPSGVGRNRTLTFENHHESGISAYLVNSLASRDPDIRLGAQVRNYSQSSYRLDYVRTDIRSGAMSAALWSGGFGWLGLLTVFLVKRRRTVELR